MNHSFSQIFKHIISKWYIVLIGLVVICGCSYLLISKTAGTTTNVYRAVVAPEQYVDQGKLLKADYDGYMTLIQSNDVIQTVIDSDPILKEKLTIVNVLKNLEIKKYNTVNIEILFSYPDAKIGEKFMKQYFGSRDSVGIVRLNEIYDLLYPDYEATIAGSTKPTMIERGDAILINSAILYETKQGSNIVSLVIYSVVGLLILLVLMVLPFIFRKVDYIEEYLVEDFDTMILGSINKIEVTNNDTNI